MVRSSRILDELEREEGAPPYEDTTLARRATKARPRLAILVLVGAAGFLLEAIVARDAAMGVGALALTLAAGGVWRGRLGGVVAAALAAILALLIPLALLAIEPRALEETVAMAFVVVWGALLLPDVVLLLRDAELQYTYGRWARRE